MGKAASKEAAQIPHLPMVILRIPPQTGRGSH